MFERLSIKRASLFLFCLTICACSAGLAGPVSNAGIETKKTDQPQEELALNLIQNGDFSGGPSNWNLWMNNGGNASMLVTNGKLKVTIINPGAESYYIGLGQTGFKIKNGSKYKLSFKAKTDTVSGLSAIIQLGASPYTAYSRITNFILTTTMKEYSRTFTMVNPTDPSSDLEFFLGGNGTGVITFDDIVLQKLDTNIPEVNYPIVKPVLDRNNIIIYEVNPFAYNGGSIKGITAYLDLIKQLGVNCIWLTPVFEGTGMGYWTYDYYSINHELGTLNDIKELVYESHKRNIMVLLDLVFNHTWTEHPFFQDALANKNNSLYKDYYMWPGEPNETTYQFYYDWTNLPNLNLSNPAVREYLYTVAEYWMNKIDVDGYRVDVAWGLEKRYPGFSQTMKNRLAAIKPDVFLLAEGDVNDASFFNNGYNSAYDWNLRGFDDTDGFTTLFNGSATPHAIHDILTRSLPGGGLPFRFAENHDTLRAASLWGQEGSKLAHTIVMTSRGYPNVFGGAEVGFGPDKTLKWSQNLPIVWDFSKPIYSYFKKLISVKNRYLKNDLRQYWINNNQSAVYSSLSVSGGSRIITVANCSAGSKTVTLTLSNPEFGTISGFTDLINDSDIVYGSGGTLTLTLDGYGTAIYLVL